jgi:hypothetical protein
MNYDVGLQINECLINFLQSSNINKLEGAKLNLMQENMERKQKQTKKKECEKDVTTPPLRACLVQLRRKGGKVRGGIFKEGR